VPVSADVKVTSSIAAEDGICFKVTGAFHGAIFDQTHPAALAYRDAVRTPPAATPATPSPAPLVPSPVRMTRFENVSGNNFHDGERFELARLKGRIILVHFWESAQDETAKRDAEYLAHLVAQYGEQGLDVVGITSESSFDRVRAFNENAEAVWPLLRDRSGLAEKYGVSSPSEILVLDGRRNILMRSARPAGIETLLERRFARR
jgi:peroxiredoxin